MIQPQRPRPMPQPAYRHHQFQAPYQSRQRPFNSYPQQMNRYVPHQHAGRNAPPQPFGYRPKKTSIIKSAFIGEDGTFDVARTFQTVDQVMKTVNQVSPIVKQVSSFFIKK